MHDTNKCGNIREPQFGLAEILEVSLIKPVKKTAINTKTGHNGPFELSDFDPNGPLDNNAIASLSPTDAGRIAHSMLWDKAHSLHRALTTSGHYQHASVYKAYETLRTREAAIDHDSKPTLRQTKSSPQFDEETPWTHRTTGDPRGDEPLSMLTSKERRIESIKNNTPAMFPIVETPASAGRPIYRIDGFGVGAVEEYDSIIAEEAERQGIDPNLVRAIIFVENSQGYYDSLKPGEITTIRPMNIHKDYWSDLLGESVDLNDPRMNIRVGVTLLRRLIDRIQNPTIAKVAALYANISLEDTGNHPTRYPALVAYAYANKLWEPAPASIPSGVP